MDNPLESSQPTPIERHAEYRLQGTRQISEQRWTRNLSKIPPTAWVFLLFFLILLLQHKYIYLYHDDYGYASLSYLAGFSTPVPGQHFSLSQLGDFLEAHYQTWGGRTLFFALEILVLRLGLWPYRIFQAAVLTIIFVMTYQLIRQTKPSGKTKALTAFLLCCCFGLIQLEIQRDGTFWATAAAVYVWPFAALFSAAAIHTRAETWMSKSDWWLLPLCIFYFASGWSHEQLGLVSICLVLGIIAARWMTDRKNALRKIDMLALTCVLLGYAVLMLAPGDQARFNHPSYAAFNALSLPEKIQINLPAIIEIILGRANFLIQLFLVWTCTAILWNRFRVVARYRIIALGLGVVNLVYGILLLLSRIPGISAYFQVITQYAWNKPYILFWIGYLCATSIAIFLFCLENKKIVLFSIYIGGLLSQVAMLVSPSVNVRSGLIYIFSLFPVLAGMIATLIEQLVHHKLLIRLGVLAVACCAAGNMIFISLGYAANSPRMKANDTALQIAANSIGEGTPVEQIELEKLVDDRFAGDMPYTPGYEYIDYWIKEYYNIPGDVELVWK